MFDSVVLVPNSVVTLQVYRPVSDTVSSFSISIPPRGVRLLLGLIGMLSLNHCKVGLNVPVIIINWLIEAYSLFLTLSFKGFLSRLKLSKSSDLKNSKVNRITAMVYTCLLYTSPSPRDRG